MRSTMPICRAGPSAASRRVSEDAQTLRPRLARGVRLQEDKAWAG
ncbi:MAG: hypothetical protein K0R61_4904 [Microvirga sp.]|nr:hypothetical protein [Microvirga sp.]